jgi:hypothetical protein
MTYQAAAAELEAVRHSGSLERVRQIIEAYERHEGSADLAESSRLLLHACDVLNSHDFGDPEGQRELIRTYAQRALVRSDYSSVEQELRLLAHLHIDNEETAPRELWRWNRLTRARRWLRALQVLADAARDAEAAGLPAMKVAAPGQDLPSGIAAEHVEEGALRTRYRSAVDRNRQNAEEFALQWQYKRLRRVYEPLAAKYITSGYAREPHDLAELKQLLNEYDWFTIIPENASQRALPPRLETPERDSSHAEERKVRRKPAARRNKQNQKPKG